MFHLYLLYQMLFYTPQNFNMEPDHQIMPWKSCQQTHFVSWTETFMSLATLQRLSKDICLSTLAFCILQNILKSWSIKHKELSSNIKSFSGTWMLNQLKWTWPASLANVSYFQKTSFWVRVQTPHHKAYLEVTLNGTYTVGHYQLLKVTRKGLIPPLLRVKSSQWNPIYFEAI